MLELIIAIFHQMALISSLLHPYKKLHLQKTTNFLQLLSFHEKHSLIRSFYCPLPRSLTYPET